MSATGTLHMICGKIAAGKSTLTATLAKHPNTIVLSEDYWISGLYREEMKTVADYVRCSAKLRAVIGPHIEQLLHVGLSVVLDFPANTLLTRGWMREIVEHAGANHQLHYLDVPDEVCRSRMHARNASGTHEYAVTDAEFDLITSHFVAPTAGEGFNVVVHRPG
jgi:predicted kinase